jgi:hypothetical protein
MLRAGIAAGNDEGKQMERYWGRARFKGSGFDREQFRNRLEFEVERCLQSEKEC